MTKINFLMVKDKNCNLMAYRPDGSPQVKIGIKTTNILKIIKNASSLPNPTSLIQRSTIKQQPGRNFLQPRAHLLVEPSTPNWVYMNHVMGAGFLI